MTHEHEHEHHAEHHAQSYADWIDSQRVAKDRYFAGAPSSPIPAEARHDFTGGYAVLFAICAGAYLLAFAVQHLLAPKFEMTELKAA